MTQSSTGSARTIFPTSWVRRLRSPTSSSSIFVRPHRTSLSPSAQQVRGTRPYVRRPVDLRGIHCRRKMFCHWKRLKTHFLVWLSVSDNMDCGWLCNAPMTYVCNRSSTNPRTMLMMMTKHKKITTNKRKKQPENSQPFWWEYISSRR